MRLGLHAALVGLLLVSVYALPALSDEPFQATISGIRDLRDTFAHCYTVKLDTPRRLYARDICTVYRGGTALGKAVALICRDSQVMLYTVFEQPIRVGDTLAMYKREGHVPEERFLQYFKGVQPVSQGPELEFETHEAEALKGLHYTSQHPYAPVPLHFPAARIDNGETLFGVDENGNWRRLPLVNANVPVISADGRPGSLADVGEGSEVRVIVTLQGGTKHVGGILIAGQLSPDDLGRIAYPRVPTNYDEPIPTLAVQPGDPVLGSVLRQHHECLITSSDLERAEVGVRVGITHLIRLVISAKVLDLRTGKLVESSRLNVGQTYPLLWLEGPGGNYVVALGNAPEWKDTPDQFTASITGPVEGASGYYRLSFIKPSWVKARDVARVVRGKWMIGEALLLRTGSEPTLFARSGCPPLRAGDAVVFTRRCNAPWIDDQRFADSRQCQGIRRFDDPRETFLKEGIEAYKN